MVYAALLRGVNVGGKNKIKMSELKACLEGLGFQDVATLLNSGNVVFSADGQPREISAKIEDALIKNFKLDSQLIRVLVLSHDQLKAVLKSAPKGFGKNSAIYQSDVAFLVEGSPSECIDQFECNPEVDKVWQGEGVIFYQRLSNQLTKSKLAKIITKPAYKKLTIRTLRTVQRLESIMDKY